jgi:hypothetical protein
VGGSAPHKPLFLGEICKKTGGLPTNLCFGGSIPKKTDAPLFLEESVQKKRAEFPITHFLGEVFQKKRADFPLTSVLGEVCRKRQAEIPLTSVFGEVCRKRQAEIPQPLFLGGSFPGGVPTNLYFLGEVCRKIKLHIQYITQRR